MTHITGPSRHQTTLFPESLDELIAQDSALKEQRQQLQRKAQEMADQGIKQHVATELEARLMRMVIKVARLPITPGWQSMPGTSSLWHST